MGTGDLPCPPPGVTDPCPSSPWGDSPPAHCGWASTRCRVGRGCVRTGRCSLPPSHSPFFLKKARSEERFLPMKTTMVAGVWSLQERGIHRPPPTFCLLFCGGSHPAVCRQDGCRRPPDPPLCTHPRSRRMLGWAKRLRRSCLTAETRLTPGRAAWWQEGTAPAAPTALLGDGRRKAGAPPLASPLAPGPPASSHAQHGCQDPSC